MPLTFITAFAPASVGNIGVGFDLLGHAIDGPRDLATVRKIAEPVIHIEAITGHVAGIEHLPLHPAWFRAWRLGGARFGREATVGAPCPATTPAAIPG